MASYAYSAINAQGAVLAGVLSDPDAGTARAQWRAKGLLAQSLVETGDAADSAAGHALKKRVNPRALQIFSRQFATMIEAGLSVVAALTILEDQTVDKHRAPVVPAVREHVESGWLLSEAMGQHPKVFSRLYIAMVEAGEAAGVLDQVLDRVPFPNKNHERSPRTATRAVVSP